MPESQLSVIKNLVTKRNEQPKKEGEDITKVKKTTNEQNKIEIKLNSSRERKGKVILKAWKRDINPTKTISEKT